MKNIIDVLDLTKFDRYDNKSNFTTLDEEKIKKMLNRLFIRFERIFPKFWVNIKSQEHLNGIKDEWFECFQRSGLQDIKLIQIGLARAQVGFEEYLPKASTFMDWCVNGEATELGFPVTSTAFDIACLINQQFSDYIHPDSRIDSVIRYTLRQIGSSRFREMKAIEAKKVFETEYAYALKKYLRGNIQDIKKSLPDNLKDSPVNNPKNSEARDKAMEAINRMLK
jgi:hypothetical protein